MKSVSPAALLIAPLLIGLAAPPAVAAPEWLVPLRDALYAQELSAAEVYPIFLEAKTHTEKTADGTEKYNALARCEYYMGRVYSFYKDKSQAQACFQRGYAAAEESLALTETDSGWELLACNLGELCTLMPKPWVMLNGPNVEKFAKNAVKINPGNIAAKLLIAERWIYAPWPFDDPPKGIAQVTGILNNDRVTQKEDLFDAYTALAYGYLRKKNNAEASAWIDKALSLYPTNVYVGKTLKNSLSP